MPMPRPPFRFLWISARLVAGCTVAWGHYAQAQTRLPRRTVAPESVYARAKQLVVNGNGAAGRMLVDSMVAASQPGTPAYAEALYWRASLSASMRDAERDLQRIIIEYPLAPRSGDALLQLGQLEAARGDRAAAVSHLEQFLLENPSSPEQGRAGLQLVRLSFEQNDARRGCLALGHALSSVPSDAVELRNQLQYYSPRCVGVDTTGVPAAASPGDVAARSGSTKGSTETHHDAKAAFALQVAAFSSRADAEALATKLAKRGLDTRVVGTKRPFRVQVGHYATRAAATAAAMKLKARKINGFVTEAGTDNR